MSLVELKDVVKRYGTHTVLNGVSLKVEKGEIIAIIGRSGSGKSTMLRCVNGLEPIQGGTVAFDGTVVNDPGTDLRKLRQHVGIVFQSFNLFPHLSVEKNITLAPKVVKRVPPAEARRAGRNRAAQGRARREDRRLARPALGRPAAAGGDRPLARHAAGGDAVRRDHLGARSRAGRRGAEGAGGDGARRHDHDAGDPRDRLRPQGRRPGRVHA